jgi:hypothetical protein
MRRAARPSLPADVTSRADLDALVAAAEAFGGVI